MCIKLKDPLRLTHCTELGKENISNFRRGDIATPKGSVLLRQRALDPCFRTSKRTEGLMSVNTQSDSQA